MNKQDANYLLASLRQQGIVDAISETLKEANKLYDELSGSLLVKLPVRHFNRLYSDLMGCCVAHCFSSRSWRKFDLETDVCNRGAYPRVELRSANYRFVCSAVGSKSAKYKEESFALNKAKTTDGQRGILIEYVLGADKKIASARAVIKTGHNGPELAAIPVFPKSEVQVLAG
ncbi:hypothetical protein [uncultured Enorma sp.]|uniref:hypothetical protein n=1 Tax=uncultured Enorma sp. TaxID=1714346 RepID=UPI00261233B7|nr:hypothetical protein [uncultured Enorma sp.]